ncbi:MAG: hypothetical protein CMH52_13735, partial [Myxococcales bacterium]|nr:hypothetical protein [Myxococcales bacterium]
MLPVIIDLKTIGLGGYRVRSQATDVLRRTIFMEAVILNVQMTKIHLTATFFSVLMISCSGSDSEIGPGPDSGSDGYSDAAITPTPNPDPDSSTCPSSTLDVCGVCDGDESSCADCAGVANGDSIQDNCGTCDANPDNDCIQDCAGDWGGAATEDECGTCDANPDNDCAAPCEDGQCPDLLIQSITYNADTHAVLVVLSNQGETASSAVDVGFIFNRDVGEPCDDLDFAGTTQIAAIAPGQTVSVNSTVALDQSVLALLAAAGAHKAHVVVDATCSVSELDETNNTAEVNFSIPDPTRYRSQGLHGYIGSSSSRTPMTHRYGASFYSSVWSLLEKPIANFQIGLPGTWFTPNNEDNRTDPLCPVGTVARDNWPERAPTYQDVFQTLEGGLGYWVGNRFHYGPPKYAMNATPDCYTNQIASPGWPFFGSTPPLPDTRLGIAQLSNRMLIPPDGLPFDGQPRGELIGYGYIALPLTNPRPDPQPTGNQSWTLFLNSANFKGPLAYYLPETWSRISFDYPFDEGRGLDARPIRDGLAGSMEINTVPQFQAFDATGTTYSKIPQLQFPVNAENRTILVRDVTFYSRAAFFDAVEAWKNGGPAPSGVVSDEALFKPSVSTRPVTYRQSDKVITGINEAATPSVFEGNVFGLQWHNDAEDGFGKMPQYFRHTADSVIAVAPEDVPVETLLHHKEFLPPGATPAAYTAEPLDGAWSVPGPTVDTYQTTLNDCSQVTYRWYRFIDQPVFQQYDWTEAEKENLQELIEKIHRHWSIETTYLPEPAHGELASFDTGLLVTPPAGLEVGYVPVV